VGKTLFPKKTLLEKKAASLKTKRSRLADNVLSNNDKSLFPMIPHQRGTNNQEVQNLPVKKQATDISNVVPQGLPREKLHFGFLLEKTVTTAETTSRETMAEEEVLEEEERRRRTMKAKAEEENQKTQNIYWVMPSYAEPFKETIMQILEEQKINLCKNKTFEKVFSNVSFKIAFANSKNIKQLIVRTKV
jgi:hypothetical protein